MRRHLRDWWAHPSSKVAIGLALVGVLVVLLLAQLQDRWYWTGDAVHGINEGGLVYYHAGGREWTVDDPGPAPAHATPVTVYVDPDDPSRAVLDGPLRWIDTGFVLVWFVAALGLVLGSAMKRARARRRPLPDGHDPEWISRYLDTQRRRG